MVVGRWPLGNQGARRKPGEPVPVCRSRGGVGWGGATSSVRKVARVRREKHVGWNEKTKLTKARFSDGLLNPLALSLVSGSNVGWFGLDGCMCYGIHPVRYVLSVRIPQHRATSRPYRQTNNTLEQDDLHLPGRKKCIDNYFFSGKIAH